ncbi:unnamed protein product, partial [marine sediment metagenome]
MIRSKVLAVIVPTVVLVAGGCLPDAPPSVPLGLTVAAEAQATAKKGKEVPLRAHLSDETWAGSVTYEWFQEFGRAVEISNAHTAEASFEVPSLPESLTDEGRTLGFRVDLIGPDGKVHDDDRVEVVVEFDPDYQSGDSIDGGTDDDDPADQSDDPVDLMSAETDKAP